MIKKVTSLVLHAEPRKDSDNARMALAGMPSGHFTYSLMASKSERTQVYLVPQNETTSSGSSSSSNSTEVTATNQETVKIVVPLLNATSGEPMNWCATFAQKPPSPLELWPCDDNNSTRSQRFAYDATSGDLSPLYTKSWAGSLARVQAAAASSNSMADVDDSIDPTGSSDEEESPSKRFYRRMAEKSAKKKKNKHLVTVKGKVGSKKLEKVQLRRQVDDPIQAAVADPAAPKEDPAASATPAPAPVASSTDSAISSPPAPTSSSSSISSDAQPPQPISSTSVSSAPASATPSSSSSSGSGEPKKGSVSLKFVPAGSSAQSFAVGKPSSDDEDVSSNDVSGTSADGVDDIGSDGETTTTAPIREAVQQSLGQDDDEEDSDSSSSLNGGATSFVQTNVDDSSSSGSGSSAGVQSSSPSPMVNQAQVQPADLEAVPTPAYE